MHQKALARLFIPLMSVLMINATASDVVTLPETVDDFGLELIGSGEFRKFGFHLYDASYWSAPQSDRRALRITYRKNIRSERLIDSTFKEWRRLDVATESRWEQWSRELAEIWPDVASGDTLIAIVDDAARQTEFFDGAGRSLGCVYDPEFGPAFLDIWLSPKTSARSLRTALVGDAKTES